METEFTHNLRMYLEETPDSPVAGNANATTLLRQAQVAQGWLLQKYLGAWLELLGGLVECEYPLARCCDIQLRAVSRMLDQIDPKGSAGSLVFSLANVDAMLKHIGRGLPVATSRSMQWGVWAREVAASMVDAFAASPFLNPAVCRQLAPCCMYAAYVVSQIVSDDGVAEEIADKMFERLPRELLDLLDNLPVAPEA